eukprot:6208777-Ditylum_brightwellii.AAC.1
MLYGLKQSPQHWYDKAKVILLEMGLKQCPNASCLFYELDSDAINHPPTPYRSGLPFDVIYDSPPEDSVECKLLETRYRSIVGSLNWISHSKRLDLATVTNLLDQHQSKVS